MIEVGDIYAIRDDDTGHDFKGTIRPIVAGTLMCISRVEHDEEDGDNHEEDDIHTVTLTPCGSRPLWPLRWDGRASELIPVPGVISWSVADEAAANRQGWGLFVVDDPKHSWIELSKFTGSEEDATDPQDPIIRDRYACDEDAWQFVWNGALKGDPVAKKALEFLYQRCLHEYTKIATHCLGLALAVNNDDGDDDDEEVREEIQEVRKSATKKKAVDPKLRPRKMSEYGKETERCVEIAVQVSGGVVQSVRSNKPFVTVNVIDYENLEEQGLHDLIDQGKLVEKYPYVCV